MKYWDGQGLRYVLRNRTTGETYLVIVFSLYLKEDVNEDGSLKPAALEARHEDLELAGKGTNGDDGGEIAPPMDASGGAGDDDVD
ncbi:hypothetical protein ONZ43_g3365 [Nemania bipapillata]|uniref:Uncharacterized protein n=1 Tax=Nemania bipapillata TaxID=110536 RepID=A0ACC2IXQ0_9PEZI|nr:hypothetical protein ONZ43_g3365 [Nemania bipapillata]